MKCSSSWRRGATLAMAVLLLAACASPADRTAQTILQDASVDGSRMAFVQQGEAVGAAPAVVFQSGLGDDHRTWNAVLQQLPATFEAFAPDRPGYGDSPARGGVRDACRIAEEQHALLRRAGLPPPYVLVGHSLGGWYQYVYARMYPGEVAGLVLLDPTHPELQTALQDGHPGAAALLQLARRTVFTPAMVQEFDAQSGCLEALDDSTPLSVPAVLMVPTRAPAYESGELQATLASLRLGWLQLTGAAALTPVADAGHYIQHDAPQAVVWAIRSLVQASAAP